MYDSSGFHLCPAIFPYKSFTVVDLPMNILILSHVSPSAESPVRGDPGTHKQLPLAGCPGYSGFYVSIYILE